MSEFRIKEGAALDSASNIDTIVSNIESSMEDLDILINNKMGGPGSGKELSTEWAQEFVDQYKRTKTTDVQNVMSEIKKSSGNLRAAVNAANQYSMEK